MNRISRFCCGIHRFVSGCDGVFAIINDMLVPVLLKKKPQYFSHFAAARGRLYLLDLSCVVPLIA